MTTLTHKQYVEKYNQTDKSKTGFQRHLDVCGLKTKMDKPRRTTKYLWGTKNDLNEVTWIPLSEMSKSHLVGVKNYLLNYPHGFDDENIGTVLDLVEVALANV